MLPLCYHNNWEWEDKKSPCLCYSSTTVLSPLFPQLYTQHYTTVSNSTLQIAAFLFIWVEPVCCCSPGASMEDSGQRTQGHLAKKKKKCWTWLNSCQTAKWHLLAKRLQQPVTYMQVHHIVTLLFKCCISTVYLVAFCTNPQLEVFYPLKKTPSSRISHQHLVYLSVRKMFVWNDFVANGSVSCVCLLL